jgi:hypothetical protein
MVEGIEDRLDRIFKLTPRRFHISDNPPFGVGLVLCGQVNGDAEDSEQFFLQHGGIPNCKPGIWTSMRRRVPNPFKDDTHTEYGVECILRWVEPGTIDISQPVEEWEAYEKATRDADAQVRPSQFVPQGTSWRRTGKYFDDGGVCTVVSTEYLTAEAAEKMNSGEDEDFSYDGYIEQLSLHGVDGGDADNQGFTIGGMNCALALGTGVL